MEHVVKNKGLEIRKSSFKNYEVNCPALPVEIKNLILKKIEKNLKKNI